MGIEAIRRAILLKKPLLSIKNDSVGLKKNLYVETINLKISSKKRNEIKCLELFQIINELGNYSDYSWFSCLLLK